MISYLKSKGYRQSMSPVLNNKEFKCISTNLERSEELSTFSNHVNVITEVYELFLSTNTYKISTVEGFVEDMRAETDKIDVVADIEQQERGYSITLSFTKKV